MTWAVLFYYLVATAAGGILLGYIAAWALDSLGIWPPDGSP